MEWNLPCIRVQGDFNPRSVAKLLVLTFEVLMVLTRGAKRRKGVPLSQPDISIAVGKTKHEFAPTSRDELKRTVFDRRFVREIGFRQTAPKHGAHSPRGCRCDRTIRKGDEFRAFHYVQS